MKKLLAVLLLALLTVGTLNAQSRFLDGTGDGWAPGWGAGKDK